MDSQGVLVHEMLGQFIEEAVNKALNERLTRLAEESERRVQQLIDEGTSRLNEAMQKAADEIQGRIHQMIEHGLRSLTSEGERVIEGTCERMVEATQKTMDDLPVGIQESLIGMTKENEDLFHRRAEEWMQQMHTENAANFRAAIQTQVDAARQKALQETTESARAICDRNIFDFRSEFENHVNRCFAGVAERLTAPWPAESSAVVPVVRQ